MTESEARSLADLTGGKSMTETYGDWVVIVSLPTGKVIVLEDSQPQLVYESEAAYLAGEEPLWESR